jgi:hypothetical protein
MAVPSAAAVVQPCPYSTAVADTGEAATIGTNQWLSVLELQKDGTLRLQMPPAQAKQFTSSFGNHGQSTEGPAEGPCTMV